jgi:hypothetical protein
LFISKNIFVITRATYREPNVSAYACGNVLYESNNGYKKIEKVKFIY